jgi:cell division protein ZipA
MALRYALLLIGLIIVAVVVFHTFDLARLRRRGRNDAAAPAEPPPPRRLEPVAGLDFDPSLDAVSEKRALAADADLGRPALPDEKIDFILRLPADSTVMRDVALGVYKQHEYELDKPHRLYGCRADSDLWSELQHDSQRMRYGDLALSVQLVDQRGPISDSELHRFSQVGLALADALHRRTQFSASFEAAAARARELHEFCETFDVIAALHVVAPEGRKFKGPLLDHAARKLGMQWDGRGIFHVKNEFSPGCRHLFSLANLGGSGEFPAGQWERFETAGLTFFMSVPCAHRPASVFDKMVSAAQALAETLGGLVQDQARRPLTKEGTAVIRHQIETMEQQMRERGIVPGSQTALRLFTDDAVD